MQRLRFPVLLGAALLLLHVAGLTASLSNALLALRFSVLDRPASGQVAIVAVDASSLSAIGVWPWPRTLHARLIDRLREAGASEIIFDIDFSASSTPEHDQAFEEALRRAGGIVTLPTFKQHGGSGEKRVYVTKPLPRFAESAWSAEVNVEPDDDGILRRYHPGRLIEGQMVPSLAAIAAGRQSIEESPFLVDFGIISGTIPVFSFLDVINHPDRLAGLRDKKVIVGASAVELGDRVNVPGGRVIPGVALQALAAESMLQGRDLRETSAWPAYAAALALMVLVMVRRRRSPAASHAVMMIASSVVIEALACGLQWRWPVSLDTAPFHLTVAATLILLGFDEINIRGLLRLIAERRFHLVATSIGDGLICTDEKARVISMNPSAESIFRLKGSDILGQEVSRLFVADGGSWSPATLPVERLFAPGGLSQELQGRRLDGSLFPTEATVAAWQSGSGLQFSIVVRDVSERRREEERIRFLAEHDPLTGLLNRRSLIQQLSQRIETAQETRAQVALLLLDLDRFKEINDTLGHASGDRVLIEAAERIARSASANAVVARLGGDEFAIVIAADAVEDTALAVARTIADSLAADFVVFGSAERVASSIGIAIHPTHSANAEQLMADADLAMYEAKGEGGGEIVVFKRAMREKFERRVSLSEELHRALADGEFELFYQPQVDLRTQRIAGAEALIRWRHPKRGLISPGEFIPVLNSIPISNDVQAWVMRAACLQARQWQMQGREVRIGVNLSPAQFRGMTLPLTTAAVLAETGLPPHLLELEVTEDILLLDDEAALRTFKQLSELGVHLAWDDFGTGYASLTYLKKFPLNRLKIDQSFVRGLSEATNDLAIADYTIRLAKVLGLAVTAEGVESPEAVRLLARMGCDEGQGYLYGRPMPASEFERAFLDSAAHTAA